jgi:hypothetical protein
VTIRTIARFCFCGIAAIVAAHSLCAAVSAEPIGEVVVISGRDCRFPDAAYNSVRGDYLVVWADYTPDSRGVFGRRVTRDGEAAGGIFRISPRSAREAYFPAIVHCAAIDEYLVTFDTSTGIQGQRVGGDGAPVGETFAISTTPGIRSAVAWSDESRACLVVYYFPVRGGAEVFARRVRCGAENSSGVELLGDEINLSRDAPYSGYPAISHGAAGDQFLVTWDHEPRENHGHIRGRRVSAATGEPIGEPFDIATSGTDNRSAIAYDSGRQRWLVQYNSSRTRGNSYDQFGRFVKTDGTLGDEIPIATTAAFEGDTLFGGDVAFVAGHGGRFFSSFARHKDGDEAANGMAGQEFSADGARLGDQATLGIGPYTCLNNAADTRLNRILTVWEGREDKTYAIPGRIYHCGPLSVRE